MYKYFESVIIEIVICQISTFTKVDKQTLLFEVSCSYVNEYFMWI